MTFTFVFFLCILSFVSFGLFFFIRSFTFIIGSNLSVDERAYHMESAVDLEDWRQQVVHKTRPDQVEDAINLVIDNEYPDGTSENEHDPMCTITTRGRQLRIQLGPFITKVMICMNECRQGKGKVFQTRWAPWMVENLGSWLKKPGNRMVVIGATRRLHGKSKGNLRLSELEGLVFENIKK